MNETLAQKYQDPLFMMIEALNEKDEIKNERKPIEYYFKCYK